MEKKTNPAKEFLRGYRATLHRQNSLIRALADLRDRQTNITVSLKPDRVQGSGYVADRMAADAAAAITLEELIREAEKKAALALAEILAAIEAVPDDTLQAVLTLRYVEGLGWRYVAERLHYEQANIFILHGRALLAVNKWLEERHAGGNNLP